MTRPNGSDQTTRHRPCRRRRRRRPRRSRCTFGRLFSQVLAKKREHLLPAVQRLLDAVHWPVVVEKAVPGAVVAAKLVLFAVLLELRLVLVNLLRRRRTILISEQTEQSAGKVS